jgi:hypothetical protein
MLVRTPTSLREAGNMLRARYRSTQTVPCGPGRPTVRGQLSQRVTNGCAMCSRVIAQKLHEAYHVQRVVRLGSTQADLDDNGDIGKATPSFGHVFRAGTRMTANVAYIGIGNLPYRSDNFSCRRCPRCA